MEKQIADNIVHVVILDVSGIYAKIHNDGYFDLETVEEIKKQYFDKTKWRIILV